MGNNAARTIVYKTLLAFGIKRNRSVIPGISESELFSVVNVEPLEKEQTDGNVSLNELTIISQLIKDKKPQAMFEIGTFDGRTALNMAHFSPDTAMVYTLDLPQKEMKTAKLGIEEGDSKYVDKGTIGERYGNNNKITQLFGDSATFDFTPYYGKMDFVFVDGSHSAPYAENDTEVALKLIRGGGTILWHDYGVWRGVTKVLNRYFSKDRRCKNLRHIAGVSLVINFDK